MASNTESKTLYSCPELYRKISTVLEMQAPGIATCTKLCKDSAQSCSTEEPDGATAVDAHHSIDVVNSDNDSEDHCCIRWFDKYRVYIFTPRSRKQWLIFLAFWAVVIGGIGFLFVWGFPKLIDHVVKPTVEKVSERLTHVQMAVIIVAGLSLIPVTLLPHDPCVWLAAMVFNFGVAVALVLIGTTFGMALPWLIGRHHFTACLNKLLKRYRVAQAALRAVDTVGPFKVVFLLRFCPVPFQVTNYITALPEGVKFVPYIVASSIGHLPGALLGVFFGANLKGLSDLLKGHKIPTTQLVYLVISMTVTVAFMIGSYFFAKHALRQLEEEDTRMRAQAAAAAAAAVVATGAADGNAPTDTADDAHGGAKDANSCAASGGAMGAVAKHVLPLLPVQPVPATAVKAVREEAVMASSQQQTAKQGSTKQGQEKAKPEQASGKQPEQGSKPKQIVSPHDHPTAFQHKQYTQHPGGNTESIMADASLYTRSDDSAFQDGVGHSLPLPHAHTLGRSSPNLQAGPSRSGSIDNGYSGYSSQQQQQQQHGHLHPNAVSTAANNGDVNTGLPGQTS